MPVPRSTLCHGVTVLLLQVREQSPLPPPTHSRRRLRARIRRWLKAFTQKRMDHCEWTWKGVLGQDTCPHPFLSPCIPSSICLVVSPYLTEVTVPIEAPRHLSGSQASQPSPTARRSRRWLGALGTLSPLQPTSPDPKGQAGRAPPVGASVGASGEVVRINKYRGSGLGPAQLGTVGSGVVIRGPSQALVAAGRGTGASPRPLSRTLAGLPE